MSFFAKITVNVDGEGPRTFAVRAIANIADLSHPMAVIADNLRAFEQRVFDTEGQALNGERWKALEDSTVKARKNRWGYYKKTGRGAEGPSRRILHWRLALRDSLTQKKDANHIEEISRTGLVFGTKDPKAKYHVKSRHFLGMPPDFVRTDVLPPIANWINGRSSDASDRAKRSTRRVGRITTPLRAS